MASSIFLVPGNFVMGSMTINGTLTVVDAAHTVFVAAPGSLGGGGIGFALTENQTTNPVGLNGYIRTGIGQTIVTRNNLNTGDHILLSSNATSTDDTCLGDGDYTTNINGKEVRFNPSVVGGTGDLILNQNSVQVMKALGVGAVVDTLYLEGGKVGIGTQTVQGKLTVAGTLTSGAGVAARGAYVLPTLTIGVGGYGIGAQIQPTFVEAGSGNHPMLAGVFINAATVTGGAATVTDTASLYIENAASATVTGANYAVWVDAGTTRLDGNVTIGGVAAVGASGAGVVGIANGTEPSTSPADMVQLYSVDLSANNATLGLRTETAVVTESVVSDRTLSVRINGTTYKLCLKV